MIVRIQRGDWIMRLGRDSGRLNNGIEDILHSAGATRQCILHGNCEHKGDLEPVRKERHIIKLELSEKMYTFKEKYIKS